MEKSQTTSMQNTDKQCATSHVVTVEKGQTLRDRVKDEMSVHIFRAAITFIHSPLYTHAFIHSFISDSVHNSLKAFCMFNHCEY